MSRYFREMNKQFEDQKSTRRKIYVHLHYSTTKSDLPEVRGRFYTIAT